MGRGRSACDGLVVVDFGQGMAGSMPGMILADNGADVVKVEPPWGDWARDEPGFLMWNRGKRSVTLDLRRDEDRARARALAGRADVVIESFRPGVADRLGIGPAALMSADPRLVHCSITGFGPAVDYEGVAGYEGIVAAVTGRMIGLDHLSGAIDHQDRVAPIFTVAPIASYGAAQLAVQGILAALLERERSGRGERVTTSLVQGLVAFLMRQELDRGREDGTPAATISEAAQRGIELCFMTAECRDGRFLQMCARQDKHFADWVRAVGLAHLLEDPRFAAGPLRIPRVEDVAALDRQLREAMRQRTADEWMRVFTEEFDIGADPFLTPEEFLVHPQMVENGRIVEIEDPGVGTCRQVGAIALLSDAPTTIGLPAPALGQHNDEVLAALADPGSASGGAGAGPVGPGDGAAAGPAVAGRPLDGVTVIEVAYYIAGPMAGTLLAELGARVIKVEPLEGDPYRRTGLQSVKFLHGKESIALDLKHADGRTVLHELVRDADVFVHSFRPGVAERLAIDDATLRAVKPDLVYVYAGSYGSKGPQAKRTAFHSTPNALVGSGILQAGKGNPPVDDSYPDSGSALGVATAMLLGLHARDRNGSGQYVETTMLASSGYIMSPYLVHYDGMAPLPVPDRGQHGLHALCRLYPCRAGWVFVSCATDRQWNALAATLGRAEWAGDHRFSNASSRRAHDGVLVGEIGRILAEGPATAWGERAQLSGAPLVAVSEVPQEEWLEAHKLLVEAAHPMFGPYWRPPAKVDFDRQSVRFGPAAAVGEHTRPLLNELGYSDRQVDGLLGDRVVATWTGS